jgi:hypothetical protein
MKTITHAIDTIEVGTSEIDEPILLDLTQIFGAIGLKYRIAILSHGIIKISRGASQDKLYLSAGEFAEAGGRTRLVVRADDGTGCNAAVTFQVQVVESTVDEACVA